MLVSNAHVDIVGTGVAVTGGITTATSTVSVVIGGLASVPLVVTSAPAGIVLI